MIILNTHILKNCATIYATCISHSTFVPGVPIYNRHHRQTTNDFLLPKKLNMLNILVYLMPNIYF
jgi:hypothetical protein